MASSSSSSSSTNSSGAAAALGAARQLVSLWKSRQASKLLKQPPPVAFSGRARETAHETFRLLMPVTDEIMAEKSSAAEQQLLSNMMQVQAGAFAQLLIALTAWLQQLPELAAALSAGRAGCPAQLWRLCMVCLSGVLRLTVAEGSNQGGGGAQAYSAQIASMLGDSGADCAQRRADTLT
jgi:hypothetical protein